MRPTLPPSARIDEVLQTLGIRPDLLRQEPGLVFLRPLLCEPPALPAVHASDLELNRSPEFDKSLGAFAATGAVFIHNPQPVHLTSFEAKSPFGREKTSCILASELLPSDRGYRQRFVHALAALDPAIMFDGGDQLPLGQEESIADLAAAYRRLPAAKFETVSGPTAPVTVRTLNVGSDRYIYFVNDSQWPMTASMQLDLPAGCRMAELSGQRRLPVPAGGNWTVPLEPFDFVAVRFWSPDVKISNVEVVPDQKLRPALDAEVQNLRQRLAQLSTRFPPRLIANSDFELPAKGRKFPAGRS